MYATARVAKKYYGVSSDALQGMASVNKIKFIRTKNNHRRYFAPNTITPADKKIIESEYYKFICARVSSDKQKPNLQHQVQLLSNQFPDYIVISDVGSGLNFNRKGLKTLLDKLFKNELVEVVVASRDRLA